ncbi:hypothetical protein PHMEG_0008878 [Phytophthora megakarya]|uniref:FYVE-type domain-containing protein n=1 Tax=Phytophthora megakarya TaxID=4795 RepID=A0A225WHM2_9STRA|nr:hypothetical protein PHMEG_0008878 [Phytophthora megakarya]
MTQGNTVSPFQPLALSSSDTNQLQRIAKTILAANLDRYQRFLDVDKAKVNPNAWKLVKTSHRTRVYLERQHRPSFTPFQVNTADDNSVLQPMLCVGSTSGKLDDVMLGIVNPPSSCVNDLSQATLLSRLKLPTTANPFRSVEMKWMELNVRAKGARNHDFVYVEATGSQRLANGERVGYQLLHSVDIPEVHRLSGRVRAQLSVCSFFRQTNKTSVSVYVLGMMNPMDERVRRVVLPYFVNTLLSTFKRAPTADVSRNKLPPSPQKHDSEGRTRRESTSQEDNCVSCSTKRSWRLGKTAICNVCSGYVCNSCKVVEELSFMTPELEMTRRKVTFCSSCAIDENVTEFSFTETASQISLSSADTNELQAVAKTIVDANLNRYQHFTEINSSTWRLVKGKDQMQLYEERQWKRRRSPPLLDPAPHSELQSMLCVGSTPGTLEEVMSRISIPSFNPVQTEATSKYTNGAVTLFKVQPPTLKDPFKSVSVKWVELDVRRRSMAFIKNRDFVYVESTGIEYLPNIGRVGYHLMHSVDILQAPALPGRIRGKLSVCFIFRQENANSVSVYALWMMNSMNEQARRIIIPHFAQMLLSMFAPGTEDGKMKKFKDSLERSYSELNSLRGIKLATSRGVKLATSRGVKLSTPYFTCVTCSKRIWSIGKFTSQHSTCKLCLGHTCSTCKIEKKPKFLTSNLKETTKDVTLCFSCLGDIITAEDSDFLKTKTSQKASGLLRRMCHSVRTLKSPGWGMMKNSEPSTSFPSNFSRNPFQPISLTSADKRELQCVVKTILDANFDRYQRFSGVDSRVWKFIKAKDGMQVFSNRRGQRRSPRHLHANQVDDNAELQSLLFVGSTPGTLEDLIDGVLDSTTETEESSISDFDAAVLLPIKPPIGADPFGTFVLKWMELDVRRRSMGLVKNRDFVYVEATGTKRLPSGEQIGYHIMHSVGIPKAHALPGRVRSELSVCSFFRQSKKSVSVYSMAILDPMNDRVRQVVVPRLIKTLLSVFNTAQIGKMQKFAQTLVKRYSELDNRRSPNTDQTCITCTKRAWRLVKFTSRHNTCMVCKGYVCNTCKIDKNLKVPASDGKAGIKKVTFCFSCITDVMTATESRFSFAEDPDEDTVFNRSAYQSVWKTRLPSWSISKYNESSTSFSNTR